MERSIFKIVYGVGFLIVMFLTGGFPVVSGSL